MAKLILMQGLPASGKTTKAKALLAEYGNAVRINRDSLRAMLHGDLPWSGKKEGITKGVAREMVRFLLSPRGSGALSSGVVILDDTNLHPGTVQSWQQLAKECGAASEILRIDTSLDECLRRDALRENHVGRHVIMGMALQYGLYPLPRQGFVLCDLDGTMADNTHRLHFVQQEPKDWDGFFRAIPDDTTRLDVLGMVKDYAAEGRQIIFVTGRPEEYRGHTWLWLSHRFPHYVTLLMRRAGDHRPDTVVKAEMLKAYFPDPSVIHAVIDDRPSLIRMWRDHGLFVIDVGTGEEERGSEDRLGHLA